MSTQMAKQAMYDKLAAEIAAAQSHLRTLKAEAEAKLAGAQIKMEVTKAIAKHSTEEHAIQGKLAELKQAAGEKWATLERDLHTQVSHFEKELKTLASKIKQN